MSIWVVVSNIFYFHPYLGKVPILTNILQRGWNHQLGMCLDWTLCSRKYWTPRLDTGWLGDQRLFEGSARWIMMDSIPPNRSYIYIYYHSSKLRYQYDVNMLFYAFWCVKHTFVPFSKRNPSKLAPYLEVTCPAGMWVSLPAFEEELLLLLLLFPERPRIQTTTSKVDVFSTCFMVSVLE